MKLFLKVTFVACLDVKNYFAFYPFFNRMDIQAFETKCIFDISDFFRAKMALVCNESELRFLYLEAMVSIRNIRKLILD